MTLIRSLFLGLIQGLAEFLPISSSGHLALFKQFTNTDLGNMSLVFDVLLHLGTLLAILVAFLPDIRKMVIEGIGILVDFIYNIIQWIRSIKDHSTPSYRKVIHSAYRKFVMLVIVSTIPTGIIGILLNDVIEAASATAIVPAIGLLITGTLLLIADRSGDGTKKPSQTSYLDGTLIGVAQGIATMPGISRSGTTITACLKLGLDKSFAVKYSFIMSIPAVLGACVLELKDFSTKGMVEGELRNYILGMLVAAVVGYICIKTMLVIVRGKKFKYFAYYCYVMGIISIIWYVVKGVA